MTPAPTTAPTTEATMVIMVTLAASGGGATPTAKPVSAYSESALSAQCNLDIKSQVTAGMGHLGAAFETAIVP